MMTTHTQLSIIVPCYNEEQRIAHTISKLLPAVDKLNISYEIILVNDGSVDDTHTIIKDLSHDNSNIKVLSYHSNKGKGYAVKCGIKKSQGEYYLIMDADLATDLSELKKFWSKREQADCLIGNRNNEHNKRDVMRNIAGGLSHGLVNTVLNLKLKDTQCGFKLLSAKTKNMWSQVHSQRRGFDFELLYLLQKNGYSIKEVDVKRNDIAGSKVTFSSYLTTWKELRNTTRLHNIKTLDRVSNFAVSALAVMGIVLYGVVNVAQAQNETTTITECSSYDISTYDSIGKIPAPAEACGDAAGKATDGFPVGGLCRTGTPFLQNITFMPRALNEAPVAFDPYSQVNGTISSITPTPDGQFIIAGTFTTYDKTPANGIVLVNADGSLDTKFDSSKLTLPSISAVAIHSDGSIFVAGSTTTIDKESGKSITTNTIIKLNADGSLDTKFDSSKLNLPSISAVAIHSDGSVFVAGSTTTIDKESGKSITTNTIIKLNPDGSLDTKFDSSSLNFSTISALAVHSDGSVFVAGSTTTIDKESGESTTTTSTIIKLNPDGSIDTKFDTGIGFNGPIYSISIDKTNRILVIGNFTIYNQQEVQNIAVLNIEDGSLINTNPQEPEMVIYQYTWSCIDTVVNYNSEGSATSYNSEGSATSYNSNGSATSYNSNGSATSYNSNGSATSYNSNLGRCGTASGGTFMSMPTTNLCDLSTNNTTVTTYDITADDGTYNWTCGIDHYTYSSVSCSAYRSSNGVCGTAQGGLTDSFPSTNLCAEGTPYLQQVQSGSIVMYTWSCIGMGTGTQIANCTSYQNPQTDVCVPYRETLRADSTRPLNINNVLLPGTKVALILDYDFENGNFAEVSNQIENEDGVIIGSSGSIDYTSANTYSLTGIINSNTVLRVTFNNLNTRAANTNNTSTTGRYRNPLARYSTGTTIGDTKGQFIQYRQPSDISARTRINTLRNRTNGTTRQVQDTIIGSNWYGCSADGWNVSLRGIVSDYLLNQIEGISTTTNGTMGTTAVNIPLSPQDWLSGPDIDEDTNQETFNVYIESLNSYININDPEERFLLWDQNNEGFRVDCDICSTVAPVTTQTGSCVDLPDHAIPNIATEITQYTGADGWFPSTGYTFNTIPSTTDCTFICENQHTRVDGECKPNIRIESCVGGMPQYAVLTVPGANTYTSTRNTNLNPANWDPSIRTYTYNPTVYSDPALNACNYKCAEHYTRNGGACIADNNTGICGGTLPANAYTINGTTFPQTRNGNIIPAGWTPSIRVYTHGYVTCGFLCNNNYTRNNTTLTCDPNTRTVACDGVQPANTNPTNGTTYNQTRNGSEWAPTISWALGSTGSCGYTCQDGYTRNGSICEPNTNFTYGRYTGDWSTCNTTTGTVINTGTVITGTYSRDIGEWGPCSLGGGTCDGFYAAAGTGGTCSNTATSTAGAGFSLDFAFTAACLTMDITYNVGRGDGNSHNSSPLGGTDYGDVSACAAHSTAGTCSADAGNNCRWFPYANFGLVSTPAGTASTTPLATCNAAQSELACAGQDIYVPGNEWGGVPYSYTSGGISGCYWNADPVMRTCNDADSEIMCELFRPGCTWNQNVGGAVQNRPVVCRNELGGIVPDSYCTQPKPDTTQPGTCNVFANGICGSALGTPSSTVPTANLCSTGYPGATPTSFPDGNGNPIWFWTCQGTAGGTMSYCSAPNTASSVPVNGVCGNSNGQTLSSAPSTNLCNVGTASSVGGTGPRSWACNGSNAGTTAYCNATSSINLTASCGLFSDGSNPLSWQPIISGTTMEEIPPSYLCGPGSTYVANSRSIYDNDTYGGETDFEGQYINGPISYTINLGQYECQTLDGSNSVTCDLNTQSPACGRRTTWNDAWPPSGNSRVPGMCVTGYPVDGSFVYNPGHAGFIGWNYYTNLGSYKSRKCANFSSTPGAGEIQHQCTVYPAGAGGPLCYPNPTPGLPDICE